MGREGHCRQISLVHVGSTHSVLATLSLPPLLACVFPPSTLLRLQVTLQGTGHETHALPRPKPLRFRFSGIPQRCRLGWASVWCLPCPSSSGSQELDECALPGCSVPYPLRGPSLSFWVHSFWMHWSSWEPVFSLVGDALSGAKFAPFPCPLPPASSGVWAGPQLASSSLVFTQSFILRTGG